MSYPSCIAAPLGFQPTKELKNNTIPYKVPNKQIFTNIHIYNYIVRFETKHKYVNHYETCHAKKVYECPLCRFKTKRKRDWIRHKNQVHNRNDIWFNCDMCDYKSKRLGFT